MSLSLSLTHTHTYTHTHTHTHLIVLQHGLFALSPAALLPSVPISITEIGIVLGLKAERTVIFEHTVCVCVCVCMCVLGRRARALLSHNMLQ